MDVENDDMIDVHSPTTGSGTTPGRGTATDDVSVTSAE